MFGWFWNMLSALGFGSKEARVLILGLDNAGKTTLIYRLKSGKINSFIPTQRANIEEFVRSPSALSLSLGIFPALHSPC